MNLWRGKAQCYSGNRWQAPFPQIVFLPIVNMETKSFILQTKYLLVLQKFHLVSSLLVKVFVFVFFFFIFFLATLVNNSWNKLTFLSQTCDYLYDYA